MFAGATEFIGQGSTYSVRRTLFPDGKDVVFKTCKPTLVSTRNESKDEKIRAEKLSAMLLELRVLTQPPLYQHKNIVDIVQVAWEGDALNDFQLSPVLVTEYADRGTLADCHDAAPIDSDVANGLRALHKCHILHGDLKLGNVLVFSCGDGPHPVAKLSDFGGSLLDSPDESLLPLATPPWNAPEWKSTMAREKLLKCDVYSLGFDYSCGEFS